MKKVLLTIVALLMANLVVYAQNELEESYKKALNAPNSKEKKIGTITGNSSTYDPSHSSMSGLMSSYLYKDLLNKAKSQYNNHSNIDLRDFKQTSTYYEEPMCRNCIDTYFWYEYSMSATVIEYMSQDEILINALKKGVSKAFRNVQEGARVAIDRIQVTDDNLEKNEVKDLFIDMLLDLDYKVVAKEYIEKLYEEQQAQQSGIYNDRTTVQENNFSAVGYYINVKVTETSLRVQVVNVSTGEYEGNATVNF